MAITHPSDISGLVLDLDPHVESYEDAGGTTPATVGNPVGSVSDQVGTIDAITQATTGAKPSLDADANGWHFLDFDGVDDWLSEGTFLPTVGGAHPFTVVTVATSLGTATVNPLWSDGSESGQYKQRDSRDYQLNFGANLRRGTPDSGRHVHHTEVATASSAMYIDNVLQGTKGNAGSNAWQAGIVIGRTGSQYSFQNYYRILVFDHVLTSQERTDLYDCLSALYANPPPGGSEPVEVGPLGTRQAQAASAPALTQHHVLSVKSTGQAQAVFAPSITQEHALEPRGTAQWQAAASAALTQLHEIAPGSTAQSQEAEAAALSQAGQLVPRGTAQSQRSEAATLTQEHALAAASTAQAQEASRPGLTQHHEIEPADTAQAQAVESVAVTEGLTLAPAGTRQAQAAAQAKLTQAHKLAPRITRQVQTIAAPAFAQTHTLAPGRTLQVQATSSTRVFEGGTPVIRTLTAVLSDPFTLSTTLRDPFTLNVSLGD